MTEPILAFVNTKVTKSQLLADLAEHRRADRIAQDHTYWRHGRGCAVGCTLRNYAPGQEEQHGLYEPLFGIPKYLAVLEDEMFENLPPSTARIWPEWFIEAVPIGADLSDAGLRFAVWMLTSEDSPLAEWRYEPVIERAAGLMARTVNAQDVPPDAWEGARQAIVERRSAIVRGEDTHTPEASERAFTSAQRLVELFEGQDTRHASLIDDAVINAAGAHARLEIDDLDETPAWSMMAEGLLGILRSTPMRTAPPASESGGTAATMGVIRCWGDSEDSVDTTGVYLANPIGAIAVSQAADQLIARLQSFEHVPYDARGFSVEVAYRHPSQNIRVEVTIPTQGADTTERDDRQT